MCRWLVYIGDESVLLEDLVTNPKHSMIQQSFANPFLPWIKEAPHQRLNHRINGDGFGVGWYHQEKENPCVFVSVKPSWNDLNLKRLSEAIESRCVFAHVRAASPGSAIVENNCHPFQFGRILFMHNGCIFNFEKWKRKLITEHLNDDIFQKIHGSTDSEFAAGLFVQNLEPLGGTDIPHSGQVLKEALLQAMLKIIELTANSDENPGASSLNIAVTNGEIVIATRFRNSNVDEPPSLYYTKKPRYQCRETSSKRKNSISSGSGNESFHSVVIASEPLSYNEEDWALVPKNHLVIITKTHKVILEPILFPQHLFFDLPPPPISQSNPQAMLAAKAIQRLARTLPQEIGTPKMINPHVIETERCKHCNKKNLDGTFDLSLQKDEDNFVNCEKFVEKMENSSKESEIKSSLDVNGTKELRKKLENLENNQRIILNTLSLQKTEKEKEPFLQVLEIIKGQKSEAQRELQKLERPEQRTPIKYGNEKLSGSLSFSPKKERKVENSDILRASQEISKRESNSKKTITLQLTLHVQNRHIIAFGAVILALFAFILTHSAFKTRVYQ